MRCHSCQPSPGRRADSFGKRLELVADAVTCVEECVAWRGGRSSPAAYGRRRRPFGRGATRVAPRRAGAARPRQHAALLEGEDESELRWRQLGALAVDVRLDVARSSRSSSIMSSSPRCGSWARVRGARPRRRGRRALPHRERFDEIVVRAELERVDPIVLGAAGGHDDDGRADPLASACSITRQPSTPGSIRSSTHTSGCSNRSRASPVSPLATPTASKPASRR